MIDAQWKCIYDMELWFDFIIGLADSLGWPIAVAFLAFLFRHPIRNLLNSIKSIRIREIQLDLGRTMETIEAQIPNPQDIQISPLIKEQIEDIALEDPISAIIDSWGLVRRRMQRLARDNNILLTTSMRRSTPRVAMALADQGIIDDVLIRVIRELQRIRNRAGRREFFPTQEVASEYVDAVELLLKVLEYSPGNG